MYVDKVVKTEQNFKKNTRTKYKPNTLIFWRLNAYWKHVFYFVCMVFFFFFKCVNQDVDINVCYVFFFFSIDARFTFDSSLKIA